MAEKKTLKKKIKKKAKNLVIKFSVIGILLFVLLNYVIAIRIVHDNNMFPFITDGELIIVYRFGKVGIEKPVLYRINGKEKLGRITAQSGDRVEITEKEYRINDTVSYSANPYPTKPPEGQGNISLTVPEGSYFLLNDYRERETDSRMFGCVSDIIGPVVFSLKYRGF